jgi:hypothetical protein
MAQNKKRNTSAAHYVDDNKFYKALVSYRCKLRAAEEEGIYLRQIPRRIGSCVVIPMNPSPIHPSARSNPPATRRHPVPGL